MSRANLTPAAGIQTGKGVAVGIINAAATSSIGVTFPQQYASTPVVAVSPSNSRLTPGYTVTTSGFTVSLSNWSPASAPASTFDWIAYPA